MEPPTQHMYVTLYWQWGCCTTHPLQPRIHRITHHDALARAVYGATSVRASSIARTLHLHRERGERIARVCGGVGHWRQRAEDCGHGAGHSGRAICDYRPSLSDRPLRGLHGVSVQHAIAGVCLSENTGS